MLGSQSLECTVYKLAQQHLLLSSTEGIDHARKPAGL